MGFGIWNLSEDVDKLETAANAWEDVATLLGDSGDKVNAKAGSVRSNGWEGDTADSFGAHRKRLVTSLDAASTNAQAIVTVLREGAGVARSAQANLDTSWATVSGIRHLGFASLVQFFPQDEAEEKRITDAEQAAADRP